MEYQKVQERFLDDVKSHQMQVLKDEDLYRHLRFRRDDSYTYGFDILTWPGYLCICGDMGTYVFSRTEDMFKFFIMSDTDWNKSNMINPGYWEEKLQSISRFGSDGDVSEFSEKYFREVITNRFEDCFGEYGSEDDVRAAVWEAIEDQIFYHLEDSHPQAILERVYNFSEEGFQFDEFNPRSCYEYTHHYIWICFAIVWGITKSNEWKEL